MHMKTEIDKTVFGKYPEFESKRLLFRKPSLYDAKDILFIRTDNDVMRFMDVTRFESVQDGEKWIMTIWESFEKQEGITWIIEDKSTNAFAGYFGFWRMIPEHCRAEIGYALNPQFWGKGFMTETLKTMMEYGFRTLNLHSVEANVNPENENSIKVLEKIGFQKEAHFKENYLFNGKFLDSIIYSLLEKNFKK